MIWVYLHILGVNCMFKDIGLDVHLDWLRFGCLASDSLDLLLKRSASFYLGGGCVRVFLSIVVSTWHLLTLCMKHGDYLFHYSVSICLFVPI